MSHKALKDIREKISGVLPSISDVYFYIKVSIFSSNNFVKWRKRKLVKQTKKKTCWILGNQKFYSNLLRKKVTNYVESLSVIMMAIVIVMILQLGGKQSKKKFLELICSFFFFFCRLSSPAVLYRQHLTAAYFGQLLMTFCCKKKKTCNLFALLKLYRCIHYRKREKKRVSD